MRYQTLLEGGNIFKTSQGDALTRRITKDEIVRTVAWLERVLRIPLRQNLIGSTGKKPDSGDIDIAVDSALVDKQELINKLTAWCKQQGIPDDEVLNTSKIHDRWIKPGAMVHFKTPINGDVTHGFAQTDFMFTNNIEWMKFVHHVDPASAYKGVDRNIMINSIAKSLGMKLNMHSGIYNRADNTFVTNDPNKIAKLLLNQTAVARDLDSVESMLKALKNDPDINAKLQDARYDFAKRGIDLSA